MNTFMAKSEEIERKWYIVDATGIALGRLASQVASVLHGKNKPIFTPHVDTGDHVIVINCDKVILTGNKLDQKTRITYSGYVGGQKSTLYRKFLAEKSDEVVFKAIKGMLPKNSMGRAMIKKLRVYKGAEHENQAQKPEVLEIVKR